MQRGVSQKVITDRSQYPSQRAVEITGYLFNDGAAPIFFTIGTRFEFEMRVRESRSRKVVWTWSKNKVGPPTETIRVEPGQWREHREIWDRRDDSGKRVPAGTYEVELTHLPFTAPVTTQVYLMDRELPGGDPDPVPPPIRVRPPQPGGGGRLQSTIQADRSRVRAGESVRLTYTVTNPGALPVALDFSSGRQYDMEVRRRPEPNARYAAGALTVWQLSRGRSYTMALTRITLAPGERKLFTETWGVPGKLPAGIYDLVGYLPIRAGTNTAEALGTLSVIP